MSRVLRTRGLESRNAFVTHSVDKHITGIELYVANIALVIIHNWYKVVCISGQILYALVLWDSCKVFRGMTIITRAFYSMFQDHPPGVPFHSHHVRPPSHLFFLHVSSLPRGLRCSTFSVS